MAGAIEVSLLRTFILASSGLLRGSHGDLSQTYDLNWYFFKETRKIVWEFSLF